MSAHAWKPGDVAMVRCSDGEWRRAFCIPQYESLAWLFKDGARRWVDDSEARPLAVVDPENTVEIADLGAHFCVARWDHTPGCNECDPLTNLAMKKAIQEFVALPLPVEPTGVGAVVQVAGRVFVRLANVTRAWVDQTAEEPKNRKPWASVCRFGAPVVLSAGVEVRP